VRTVKRKSKKQSILTGVAGEYFVAAELSRRGHIASITLRNTRGMDILATNLDASRSITIQCKTTQKSRKAWLLNEKCEDFYSPKHFYVFVTLGSVDERPSYHIVPSRIVAKRVKTGHRNWKRKRKRKDGKDAGETSVRLFSDANDEFLERWNLLEL
jgi:hypothetical protein